MSEIPVYKAGAKKGIRKSSTITPANCLKIERSLLLNKTLAPGYNKMQSIDLFLNAMGLTLHKKNRDRLQRVFFKSYNRLHEKFSCDLEKRKNNLDQSKIERNKTDLTSDEVPVARKKQRKLDCENDEEKEKSKTEDCEKIELTDDSVVVSSFNKNEGKEQKNGRAGREIRYCPGCHKSFTNIRSMDIHIEFDHPDSKYFKCLDCYRSYKYFHNLGLHSKIHRENSKKHACDICGKRFVDSDDFKSHRKRVHKESELSALPAFQTFGANDEKDLVILDF